MSIRNKLLQTLEGTTGKVYSGEVLAREHGVSRTAIWKQVQGLRDAGFPIESMGRQGYRLLVPFDSSLSSYSGSGKIVPHYSMTTQSTQMLAKAGAAAELPEGHVWVSEIQTKGRGRLERAWESSYGGLWFSILLRPNLAASRVAPLTLLAGVCLREAIYHVSGLDLKLKWPNDLLIQSGGIWKKCAGILTEMSGQLDRADWVIVGVGVNVNNRISQTLEGRASSLAGLSGRSWSRALFLESFIDLFMRDYHKFKVDGFAGFRARYWKNYYAPRKLMVLKSALGLISGKAVGIDAHGAIMIESRRKIRTFVEGEVVL